MSNKDELPEEFENFLSMIQDIDEGCSSKEEFIKKLKASGLDFIEIHPENMEELAEILGSLNEINGDYIDSAGLEYEHGYFAEKEDSVLH